MTQTTRSRSLFPQVAAHDPTLEAVWDYWNARRGRRRCPSRSDLDPLDIPKLLPHVGLVDVEDDARAFRFRVIGTHMNEIFGENYTGKVLDPGNRGAYATMLQDAYADCAAARRPLFSETEAHYRDGRRLTSRRLVLPLANDDDSPICMLLFATTFRPHGPGNAAADDHRWLEPPYRAEDLVEVRTLAHVLL